MAIFSKLVVATTLCVAALSSSMAEAKKPRCVQGNRVKVGFDFDWEDVAAENKFGYVVCALHSSAYDMWSTASRASNGLANLAVSGTMGTLDTELRNAERAATPTVFDHTVSSHANFHPHSGYNTYLTLGGSGIQYVSCAVKIVNSPDWFVGLQKYAVCDAGGDMIETGEKKLVAWDAGVREGEAYVQSSTVTSPTLNVHVKPIQGNIRVSYGKAWIDTIDVKELCEAGSSVRVRFNFNWPTVGRPTDAAFGALVCGLTTTTTSSVFSYTGSNANVASLARTDSVAAFKQALTAAGAATVYEAEAQAFDGTATIDAEIPGAADYFLTCAANVKGTGTTGVFVGIPTRRVCNGKDGNDKFTPIITPADPLPMIQYSTGATVATVVTEGRSTVYGSIAVIGVAGAPALSALAAAVAVAASALLL